METILFRQKKERVPKSKFGALASYKKAFLILS